MRRLYEALPALNSAAFLQTLKSATAEELPAEVLVLAFRQLRLVPGEEEGRLCHAAEATLTRLLATEHENAYLVLMRHKAKRMVGKDDSFNVEDLVHDAKQEIGLALAAGRDAGAEKHWIAFQHQRLIDAWRLNAGRRGERRHPPKAAPVVDRETGEEVDRHEFETGEEAWWHGKVSPDRLEWLEGFIARTCATFKDSLMRAIAHDYFRADRPKVWSADPSDKSTLCQEHGVDRDRCNRIVRAAKAKLLAALSTQDECDIDIERFIGEQ
jgi:hypothetical protein